MNAFHNLHGDIIDVNGNLSLLLRKAKSIPEMPDQSFAEWEKTCQSIEKQITEEIIRVAVVGAIKSGKSTFVNSLLNGDYLKRGAGVVTSIVTRVRFGNSLKAHLFFKSWDEVNEDIDQAMVLLPSAEWKTEGRRFDIREDSDRENLASTLKSLGPDALHTDGFRNANSVLLSSYLKGYETAKTIVSSETHDRWFDENQFNEHLAFVGEDALAVYLHDIQLEINTGNLGADIEVADCQGSDSPNPLHLAMIQDYLLFTHLIIYVISSRTGLRQADIRFLTIIKKMGLLDNMLFVVNCDLSEHESLSDLTNLLERIEEELSLIKPKPDVYAFSSLYSLFKSQQDRLTAKDEMRMAQWESEKELVEFSNRSAAQFQSNLRQKLTGERNALLVNNHIERLGILAAGLNHWAEVNWEMLTGDLDAANNVVSKIQQHQEKMDQIGSVIRSTLDGAAHKAKEELKADVDRFFRGRNGSVLSNAVAFVKGYDGLSRQYEAAMSDSGFADTLYLAYQDFKQAVDRYIAEEVNPLLIRFVKEKQAHMGEYLQSVAAQYDGVIRDTLTEYDRAMGSLGMSQIKDVSEELSFQDVESIRSGKGLTLPISVETMRYSTSVKTEATLRLGLYNTLKFVKRIFRRPVKDGYAEEMRALKHGIAKMKQETEGSIHSHFMDQKENIKFQYFFKLADAVANSCHQMLLDRFKVYASNLSQLSEKLRSNADHRDRASDMLQEIIASSKALRERIAKIKEESKGIN